MTEYVLIMSIYNFVFEDSPFSIEEYGEESNSLNFINDSYKIFKHNDLKIVEMGKLFYENLFRAYNIKAPETNEDPTEEELSVFDNIHKYFREVAPMVIAMGYGYSYALSKLNAVNHNFINLNIDFLLFDTGYEPRLREEGYASPYTLLSVDDIEESKFIRDLI